jgi:hypothetical protein
VFSGILIVSSCLSGVGNRDAGRVLVEDANSRREVSACCTTGSAAPHRHPVFGIEPRFGSNLQSEYDIRVADRELRAKLAPRIRVFQPAGACTTAPDVAPDGGEGAVALAAGATWIFTEQQVSPSRRPSNATARSAQVTSAALPR